MDEIREIIGNTTATPNPRPDWAQTDPTKADYIKNKPMAGEVMSVSIVNGVLVLEQTPSLITKGDKGDPGDQGPKGDAYILTDEDKSEIAADVLANFPSAEETSV